MNAQELINALNANLNAWDRAKEDGCDKRMLANKIAADENLKALVSLGYTEDECFEACGR